MKENENRLIISQSMLKDWRKMCPLAFQYKWFIYDGPEEESPFYIGNKHVVILGNIYEQNIIGISRGGKTTNPPKDLTSKPVYERMLSQAALTKNNLRKRKQEGSKIVAVQERIEVSYELNGVTVYIDGNLDILWKLSNGTMAIEDLKLSSKLDASFGEFQWKNLQYIDYTQSKHYNLLVSIKFGQTPEETPFQYNIADTSTDMLRKIIDVSISSVTIEEYKHELYHTFIAISEALEIDYFPPNNTYEECFSCPIKDGCKHRNDEVPIEYVEI